MSVEFLLTPGFVKGSPIGLFQAAFGISSPPLAEGPKSNTTRDTARCDHNSFFIGPPGARSSLFDCQRIHGSTSPSTHARQPDTGRAVQQGCAISYRRKIQFLLHVFLRSVSKLLEEAPIGRKMLVAFG